MFEYVSASHSLLYFCRRKESFELSCNNSLKEKFGCMELIPILFLRSWVFGISGYYHKEWQFPVWFQDLRKCVVITSLVHSIINKAMLSSYIFFSYLWLIRPLKKTYFEKDIVRRKSFRISVLASYIQNMPWNIYYNVAAVHLWIEGNNFCLC